MNMKPNSEIIMSMVSNQDKLDNNSTNICMFFNSTESLFKYNIGFSDSLLPFIVLPIASFCLSFLVILLYFFKMKKMKGQHSLEKMLFVLIFAEMLMTIYWIISGTYMNSVKTISENCTLAQSIAVIYTLLQYFDISVMFFNIHNLWTIVYNPIEGLKESEKRFKIYISVSFAISLVIVILAYVGSSFGLSSMFTCYLTNNFHLLNSVSKLAIYHILLFYQIAIYVVSGVYIGRIYYFNKVNPNIVLEKIVKKYLGFFFIYICCNFPTIILHYITLDVEHKDAILSYRVYIFICCMLGIILGAALGVYRLLTFNYENSNDESSDSNFESMLSIKIIEDLFIGLAYSIKHSSENPRKTWITCFSEYVKIIKNNINLEDEWLITKQNLNFEDKILSTKESFEVEFYEIAPLAFREIRKFEGINEAEMLESFKPMNNNSIFTDSAGKSGSIFISTDDKKYIIKSMNKDELDVMLDRFLLEYVRYIHDNKNSLLCRIYGIYKIKEGGNYYYFVLMRNIFGLLDQQAEIKEIYDLKGSTKGREVKINSNEELKWKVQKDLNFLKKKDSLQFSEESKKGFIDTVKADAEFLSTQDIMDYSLLIIKFNITEENWEYLNTAKNTRLSLTVEEKSSNLFQYKRYMFLPENTKTEIYIISIIDYLQLYNFKKLMENRFKATFLPGYRNEEISSVPPYEYSKRFSTFIEDNTNRKYPHSSLEDFEDLGGYKVENEAKEINENNHSNFSDIELKSYKDDERLKSITIDSSKAKERDSRVVNLLT